MKIRTPRCIFILLLICMPMQLNANTLLTGYSIGLDIFGAITEGSSGINYAISDFYNNEKYGNYKFSGLFGLGFNFGLMHYDNLETELFIDFYSGSDKAAPNYYDYINYNMSTSGIIMPFGMREHYYIPIIQNFDLDLAIGIGGVYTWGSYTDKHGIEDYHQVVWKNTSFSYDYSVGFLWKKSENFAIRFGYQRTELGKDYIGRAINKIYIGFKGVIPRHQQNTSKKI